MGVLHAQDLLLAAGTVVAGSGLKNTDGNDLIPGLRSRRTGGTAPGAGTRAGTARQCGQRQGAGKRECKKLFHQMGSSFLSFLCDGTVFSRETIVRACCFIIATHQRKCKQNQSKKSAFSILYKRRPGYGRKIGLHKNHKRENPAYEDKKSKKGSPLRT